MRRTMSPACTHSPLRCGTSTTTPSNQSQVIRSARNDSPLARRVLARAASPDHSPCQRDSLPRPPVRRAAGSRPCTPGLPWQRPPPEKGRSFRIADPYVNRPPAVTGHRNGTCAARRCFRGCGHCDNMFASNSARELPAFHGITAPIAVFAGRVVFKMWTMIYLKTLMQRTAVGSKRPRPERHQR